MERDIRRVNSEKENERVSGWDRLRLDGKENCKKEMKEVWIISLVLV